jgi:hypothetical protein
VQIIRRHSRNNFYQRVEDNAFHLVKRRIQESPEELTHPPHGRGCGVGRSLGIGFGLGVGVGRIVAVGVAVGVSVGVGVTVGVGVGVTGGGVGLASDTKGIGT